MAHPRQSRRCGPLPGAPYSDLATPAAQLSRTGPHGHRKASKPLLAQAQLLPAGWKRPTAALALAVAEETLLGRLFSSTAGPAQRPATV